MPKKPAQIPSASVAQEVKPDVQILYRIRDWCPAFRSMGAGPYTREQIEKAGWRFAVMVVRNHVEPVDVRDPQ